jgi:hypothetical protein
LELAGLLGISFQMRKCNAWKCPFHYCPSDSPSYATMQEHVRMEHTEDEKLIYSGVGGFWATLIGYFHQTGRWPMASDIFFKANQDRGPERVALLERRIDLFSSTLSPRRCSASPFESRGVSLV